ncbi:tetratricopeptide repeat protein [Antarcticibacterium flavum]|uniref:Tetratricopeptide repeat protein n=1 Tax=Antarcticibacterium flavum TaxID=2058175 RepID=A0A5B7X7L0_9FLAO|nr:hypothetical protein [Antarcticibacterium sp. W02-3]QCY71427.1 tetratricopeptide repeat protein [Antarcticibacterium flavum]
MLLAAKAGAQAPALAVADSLFAVGETTAALEHLEEIDPKTEAVYLKLAKYQSATGRNAAAMENYQIVLKENPERVLTTINYAKALAKAGLFREADSLYSNLSQRYPENANFYYQRGLIKEHQKEEGALDFYKQTIEFDPRHQAALYKLARHELGKSSYDMAKNYCLMGLEHHPDNASLLSVLGQTYSARAQYKKAIPVYKKLVALGQESEFIFTRLGFAYYREGDITAAIEAYNRALILENGNSATHYILGKLYALKNELDKSETHLLMSILIKKQPVDAEYLSLGLTYKLKEQYKDALDYLNKALDENRDNERAMYERAIAADNYFADLSVRIKYYRDYLEKYETIGDERMLQLAENRLSDLVRQRHLAGE